VGRVIPVESRSQRTSNISRNPQQVAFGSGIIDNFEAQRTGWQLPFGAVYGFGFDTLAALR